MEKSIYTKEYATFLLCLRKARKAAGLTQERVANDLGTTQSAISKWERGERRVDIVELRMFCRVIGVSLRQFITSMESAIDGEEQTGDAPEESRSDE